LKQEAKIVIHSLFVEFKQLYSFWYNNCHHSHVLHQNKIELGIFVEELTIYHLNYVSFVVLEKDFEASSNQKQNLPMAPCSLSFVPI
jgi:hypothetical protein